MRRRGTPLSILILDVDHFKRINDRFGHAAGDEALRRVAEALRAVARASDLVARFGGEEFVLVAPDFRPHRRPRPGRAGAAASRGRCG